MAVSKIVFRYKCGCLLENGIIGGVNQLIVNDVCKGMIHRYGLK